MSSPFIIIDEITNEIENVNSKIAEVKTVADTISSNVNNIKTYTATNNSASATGTLSQKLSWIGNSLIGATGNTGGSTTAGTIMAKLNAIIEKQNDMAEPTYTKVLDHTDVVTLGTSFNHNVVKNNEFLLFEMSNVLLLEIGEEDAKGYLRINISNNDGHTNKLTYSVYVDGVLWDSSILGFSASSSNYISFDMPVGKRIKNIKIYGQLNDYYSSSSSLVLTSFQIVGSTLRKMLIGQYSL